MSQSFDNQRLRKESDKRQARVSCEPCRAKKIRCPGEHPTCSKCLSKNQECFYSLQMPIGRPRKQRSTLRPSQRNKQTSPRTAPHLQSSSPHDRNVPTIEARTEGELTEDLSNQPNEVLVSRPVQTVQMGGAVAPYLIDFENYQRARTTFNSGPQPTFPSVVIDQPGTDSCACLSVLYLILDQLRVKTQLIAPDDLTLLRDTINTATDILNCKQCPLRYFSVIQNAALLGVVCMCLAECYARILDMIDTEERRASAANEQKQLSISGVNIYAFPHDESVPKNISASFLVETKPSEWAALMRNAVKVEIFGVEGHREKCFMFLVERLEERQRFWHQTPPASDCPPNYRSTCRFPDQIPTCLMIIDDAKRLIDLLSF